MRRMDGRLRAALRVFSFRRSPAVLSAASSYPIRISTPQPLHVNEEVPHGRLKRIAAFYSGSIAAVPVQFRSSTILRQDRVHKEERRFRYVPFRVPLPEFQIRRMTLFSAALSFYRVQRSRSTNQQLRIRIRLR